VEAFFETNAPHRRTGPGFDRRLAGASDVERASCLLAHAASIASTGFERSPVDVESMY
jgi:hypothetical protein